MSASLLATLLSLAPLALAPPAGESASATASAPVNADEYAAALARVRTTQNMANEDPQLGATQLRDALQLLQGYGTQLAKDPEGQSVRTMAQLTLARALLAIEDADGARAVMDEAIRTSRGDPLPTSEFGPGLVALHRERASVLEKAGTGTIDVECKQPCRVYLNERPTDVRTEGLVLGRYRVWIESSDGSERPMQSAVNLAQPDQIAALSFGSAPIEDDPEPEPVKPRKRIMPRGAEIALLVAGVAAIGVGASLLAIDERCPNGLADPRTTACPKVYVTQTAGIVALAAGGAVGLLGGITLAVDEVRLGKQRSQQVMLTWTLRF
ncbi:hypothetical protein ACNOYE_37430 [Nannocystaceae bacterium ST9]